MLWYMGGVGAVALLANFALGVTFTFPRSGMPASQYAFLETLHCAAVLAIPVVLLSNKRPSSSAGSLLLIDAWLLAVLENGLVSEGDAGTGGTPRHPATPPPH